jgi:hypothetical protein
MRTDAGGQRGCPLLRPSRRSSHGTRPLPPGAARWRTPSWRTTRLAAGRWTNPWCAATSAAHCWAAAWCVARARCARRPHQRGACSRWRSGKSTPRCAATRPVRSCTPPLSCRCRSGSQHRYRPVLSHCPTRHHPGHSTCSARHGKLTVRARASHLQPSGMTSRVGSGGVTFGVTCETLHGGHRSQIISSWSDSTVSESTPNRPTAPALQQPSPARQDPNHRGTAG